MKGMTIVEQAHVVVVLPPTSVTAAMSGVAFHMENWAHASIICSGGAGSGLTMTIYECRDSAGSGATLIGFDYAEETTVDGDTLAAALAAAGTAGRAVGTSNVFLVAELDADQLSDNYDWVRVNVDDPGTSRLLSIIAVLSGGRFQEDIVPTAIA